MRHDVAVERVVKCVQMSSPRCKKRQTKEKVSHIQTVHLGQQEGNVTPGGKPFYCFPLVLSASLLPTTDEWHNFAHMCVCARLGKASVILSIS